MSVLNSKRFVMRKTLIGNNTIITFTNKKGITYTYDHDAVYSANQEKLNSMECWHKYGNYTNSNNLPTWAREHQVTAE
tara:strand:- start:841 stop:1074 length:234 start_codon:yes stop_codon:yes gene_type:complete